MSDNTKNWSVPIDGVVHVPDYLDDLVNKIGMHYKMHTVSKAFGEELFICRITYAAEQFFNKNKTEEVEAMANAMAEGADLWQREYDNCRAILRQLVELKLVKEKEGKTEVYQRRQPLAWKAAIEFLDKYQHQEP